MGNPLKGCESFRRSRLRASTIERRKMSDLKAPTHPAETNVRESSIAMTTCDDQSDLRKMLLGEYLINHEKFLLFS